jgi:CheY-like chemotaxis protein
MANDSRKTILLVDDDVMHLTVTEAALKDKYDVQMVKSGKEALEFLGKGQNVPDLIMLDILMPEMDGWAVFDRITDIASLKFTPIMFFTSVDEESAKEKAYALGALDYITKPCKKTILVERIEDSLQKAELKRQQFGV